MGNFVHRDTLEFRRFRHTPDFTDPPWLEVRPGSADEMLLRTVPVRYLTLTGDVLAEMSRAEKDAVDANAEAARITALRSEAEASLAQNRDDRGLIIRALARLLLDEINALRSQAGMPERTWTQMQTALVGKLRAGEGEA